MLLSFSMTFAELLALILPLVPFRVSDHLFSDINCLGDERV